MRSSAPRPARPSAAGTRRGIATAAARLFGEQGYDRTSVRAIAAAAGVDPALVIRYFGSKEELFLETIQLHAIFDAALQAPLPELGERLVRTALEVRGTRALRVHAGLVRASGHARVQEALGVSTRQGFVEPLTARLEGPDRVLRARLVTAQVLGLLDALALREDEVLLHADVAAVLEFYVPALDALIVPGNGSAPGRPAPTAGDDRGARRADPGADIGADIGAESNTDHSENNP